MIIRWYGATVHSLNGGNRGKAYAPRLWAAAFAAIRTEHLRGRFDVLQAFWVNEPGVIGLLAARAFKIPFVASVAGGELAALRDIDYGGQLHFIERMMTRAVIQNVERVTVGSRYLKDIALRHRSKIEVLPLGVDTTLFSPAQHTQTRPFKLLNVASLVPVKGHTTLLDAMAKLESYEACLEIVGSGELETELTARREESRNFVAECDSRVRFRTICCLTNIARQICSSSHLTTKPKGWRCWKLPRAVLLVQALQWASCLSWREKELPRSQAARTQTIWQRPSSKHRMPESAWAGAPGR